MSLPPTLCFRSLLTACVVSVALGGCADGGHETQTNPPVAASTPAPSTPAPSRQPAPSPQPAPPPVTQAESRPAVPSVAVVIEPTSTQEASSPRAAPAAPAPTPEAEAQQPPQDPLVWLKESEARKADYQLKLAEAQANAQNALTNVEVWQRNALAAKNPFLARPQLSNDQSAAVAGMNGAERVRWSEERLAEAQAASNAAQKALDDLKANPPN